MEIRFTFADNNELNEVMDGVDSTPYDGSGTRTGEALTFALENLLTVESGRRKDAPTIVITVTDGESQVS